MPEWIGHVVDRNPARPGSRIPIVDKQRLRETRPACIAILPWNLRDELIAQLDYAPTLAPGARGS